MPPLQISYVACESTHRILRCMCKYLGILRCNHYAVAKSCRCNNYAVAKSSCCKITRRKIPKKNIHFHTSYTRNVIIPLTFLEHCYHITHISVFKGYKLPRIRPACGLTLDLNNFSENSLFH